MCIRKVTRVRLRTKLIVHFKDRIDGQLDFSFICLSIDNIMQYRFCQSILHRGLHRLRIYGTICEIKTEYVLAFEINRAYKVLPEEIIDFCLQIRIWFVWSLLEPLVSYFHETWFNFKPDKIPLMSLTHHRTGAYACEGIKDQIAG